MVFDLADQEDDPLFQQARIDVVGALPAWGLLDDVRDQSSIGYFRGLSVWRARLSEAKTHGMSFPY